MRNVVAYELMSLDGVGEEPGDWMVDPDEAVFANLGQVIARQDTVLLGRGTYDYWVDYWPTSDLAPFAPFINATPKVVFTSTTPATAWEGAIFHAGPAEQVVADLRQQPGGDIGSHGSLTLLLSLIAAGLVDELRLVVAPTLAGRGRRLFADTVPIQRFTLLDVEHARCGAVFLHYRQERASGQ